LDLACGRGRHAVVLASQGYDVTGVDLSAHSIDDASANGSEHLRFFVHDMRRPVAINYFDAVFNFFTSFGYFESSRDNIRTLNAVASCLRKNGSFVLDYFNSEFVRRAVESNPEGTKSINDVIFRWKKKIEGEFCIKMIEVNDQGRIYHFEERVQLFSEKQMREMLENLFVVNKVFGDYSLNEFNAEKSDRMIFYCSKRS
jgi:SAM-dependent methyltransferase